MSPDVFKRKVFPELDDGQKLFFILIDNFRFDQWRTIRPLLSDFFTISEDLYTSILPTATQYARNAIFSGLMPVDIARMFPDLWVDEDEPEGKNLNESPLIATQFERFRRKCQLLLSSRSTTPLPVKSSCASFSNFEKRPQCHRVQLHRHAVARPHRIAHDTRTRCQQRGLPLHHRILVPPLARHRILPQNRQSADTRLSSPPTTAPSVWTTLFASWAKRTPTPTSATNSGETSPTHSDKCTKSRNPTASGFPPPPWPPPTSSPPTATFSPTHNNYNYYVQYYTGTFQHGGISMEEMLIPLITLTAK